MDPADLLRLLDEPVNGAIKTEDEIKKEPHEDDEEMMSTLGRQAVYARVFNVGYAVAMRMESHGDLIETDLIETKDKTILKWRKIWARHRKGSTEKSKPEKKKKKTRTQTGRKVAKKVFTNRTAKDNSSGRKCKGSLKSEKPPTPKNVTAKRAAKQDGKTEKEPMQKPKTVESAKKRGRPPKTTSSVELLTKKQKFTKITSAKENNPPKPTVNEEVPNKEVIKKETPKQEPKPAEPAKKRGRPAEATNTTEPPKKQQKSTSSTKTIEKKKYTCPMCMKPANKSTCLCNQCGEWVHLKCAKIRASKYDDSFRCQNCSI
ncbi:unnamed protein product [Caenorhabditis brenneri]